MAEVKVNKEQALSKGESPSLRRGGDFFTPMLPFGRMFGMSPFGLMRDFTSELERLFHRPDASVAMDAWSPAVDVRKCNGDLVVTAELPGLKKEEVKVELTGENLVIQGERKREHTEDHEGYHRYERSYGHFYRAVPLPEGAKTDQVKAELQDGVLKISVPVAQSPKPQSRQIPIETQAAAAAKA
jgi:HSP20 family protein